MTPRGFGAPPFVVWRVVTRTKESALPFPKRARAPIQYETLNYSDDDLDLERSEFPLVPHAVFLATMRQALVQLAALGFFFSSLFFAVPDIIPGIPSIIDYPHPTAALRALVLTLLLSPVFVCLAMGANLGVIALLNARPMQTTKALLQLCPETTRREYEECFPSIMDSRYAVIDRLRITLQALCFFFRLGHGQSRKVIWPWRRRALIAPLVHARRRIRIGFLKLMHSCRRLYRALRWRGNRVRLPAGLFIAPWTASPAPSYSKQATDRHLNLAKLGALSLRREDSRLHALSAFAAATTFVPQRRHYSLIGRIHINFILSYFSPLGFGFALCMLLFVVFVGARWWADDPELPRFPLIVSIVLWLAQGLWYVRYTLGQDFTSLFRDYFVLRIFPKSMTSFAQAQIAAAPDLATEVQGRWLDLLIVGLLLGLASLHAALLHSLTD
jgi:hypothetical protein